MGKKPRIGELDYLFAGDKELQITDKLYKEKTGVDLPERQSYLKNYSALAERARKFGYIICKIEDKPVIERTVYFKKEEK